jgi:hypothetical protein
MSRENEMIATKKSENGAGRRTRAWALLAWLFWPVMAARADDFGDISLSAQCMYSGNTFHGYAETQVMVQNHSGGQTHQVTLIFPDQSYGNGNFIDRLARTVTLAPGAREIVPLLQPPLPASGSGQIRVEVDGRHEGEIRAPNGNNHCSGYSRSGQSATVFISRSLDADAVGRLFDAGHGAFTAEMAVGAPDSKGSGYQPNSWMPDTRRGGQTNWLELDYAAPQAVDRITIFAPQSPLSTAAGVVELQGASGTNLARISMSAGTSHYSGSGWITEIAFPTATGPVKTVRLNFGRQPPYNISVDAVQISGLSGTQWAADARASSDNNASAGAYAPGSVSADSVESLRAEMPVSDWSENWLAYTPFDAMVLGAGDLAAASSATANAIQNYLEAGGDLFIFGDGGLPDAWHSASPKSFDGGVEYEVGFGNCYVFHSENPAALDAKSVRKLRERVRNDARYWQDLPYDSGAANTALPIVANLKVPVRGIVFIMLLFVIVIGPVNLIYLNRRRRRTWMLWTIPVISLVTTLLVFAYSLLSEGITPDTRIAGLTVLDQASHRAATVGGTAFYCPLTPSGGLQFDFGTEATPLVEIGYRSGTPREVDWTQSQHFSHGWVSARVAAYFHLRKAEARRERLQVVKVNGKLQVVNSLGAPIASLWVADADRHVYTATRVAAGEQAGLIPVSTAPSEKSGADGLLRDIGFAAHPEALGDNAGKYLRPNTYIAVLDGNPFIENALGPAASAKRTKTSAVIFGILAPADLP